MNGTHPTNALRVWWHSRLSRGAFDHSSATYFTCDAYSIVSFWNGTGISGLVVEYIVAIDVTRVRFPADAFSIWFMRCTLDGSSLDHDSTCGITLSSAN